MDTRLHNNATTTPARRVAIQASGKPVRVLAQEFGVTEDVIHAWRNRKDTADHSHTAHNPNTTVTTAQEAVVVTLRRMLWLPLEDPADRYPRVRQREGLVLGDPLVATAPHIGVLTIDNFALRNLSNMP